MQKKKINKTISQLTQGGGKIDTAAQEEIIAFMFNSFVQYDKVLLLISSGKVEKVLTKSAFKTMCKLVLSENFPNVELLTFNEEKGNYKWNLRIDEIYDAITTINSCSMIRYESNPFAKKQIVDLDEHTRVVTITTNTIHIKKITKPKMTKEEYTEIIRDYKKHFIYFDQLLKLIIDMRFAKDKKASWLHLRVKSDWGKSFLSGLFKGLDIGIEVDYENFMNKNTSSIYPLQIRNTFVLLLDEFNNFSQEMKKLSHEISLAPKFGMSETVELYLKILMSAEKSPSFTGGVDAQIVNRVMVFDIPDDSVEELQNRPVVLKYGNARYKSALEYYTYLSFNQQIEKYLEMEEMEAYKVADIEVRKTYKAHKMQGMENINQTIVSIVTPILEEIASFDVDDQSQVYRTIQRNVIRILDGKHEGMIFIKQPHKTFETILKNEVIETEYKKMKFKLSGINEFFNIVADHTKKPMKLFGKAHKGILINPKPKEEIPLEIENTDGTVKNMMLNKENGYVDDMNNY